MRFRILGPLEVEADGHAVTLGGPKPRGVLAMLLLHANEPVSAERLALALWGEDAPAGAVKTVQVHVSRLRKALGAADVLTTEGAAYRLRVRAGELDADTFEGLVDAGREALAGGRADEAAATLREALSLWRGPPLHELASLPFAAPEIERLEEHRLAALEARVEADLAAGRHAQLVGELQRLTREHPWRERLHRHAMLALYRCGRQADALAAFRETRRLLADELGLEPSEDLRRLERQMLAHAPELDLAEVALPAPRVEEPPASRAPAAPARKLLSVVSAEVASSTELADLDPESMHGLLDRVSEACATILERHGGAVVGDATVGVFGLTETREDDALRAVRAAVEMRAVAEVELKIAVSSGEAFVGAGARRETFATGDAMNVAARLQDAAAPGEILLGDLTHRLAERLVDAERAAQVPAWRLLGLRPDASARRPLSATPLIGRAGELEQLRATFAQATDEAACRLVTLLGPPGIGKSRLASELVAAVDATAVVGRCPPSGEGDSFGPLAEIVGQLAGSDPEARLVEVLGGDEPARSIVRTVLAAIGRIEETVKPEEVAWAVRRLLERVARARPLLVVVDDIQWAGPTLLDVLEHVAAFSTGAPMLLLCIARPELVESRPSWTAPQPARSHQVLERLSDADARALVDAIAADGDATSRIVDTAEGNPLFLEQLVAAHAEQEGATLPVTLQTVLAARIDRLEPGERLALRYASVEGRSFHASALAALLPESERPATQTRLLGLVQKQFVHPEPSELAGEDVLSFAHGLIREAAYGGLPKQVRAEAHVGIAGWLEERASGDELIGFHLESAARERLDLGERDREIALEASTRLASASQSALLRGDAPGGAQLLERAAALRAPDAPAGLLTRLGAALFEAGRLADADRVLLAAVERARESGEAALESRALVEREFVRLQTDADSRVDEVRRIADAAQDVLGRQGDDLGECRASCLRAWAEWTVGQAGAADDAWRGAADHARRAGDQRELFEALCWRASAAVFGPAPVPEAIRRCAGIRDQVDGSPVALAVTLHPLGSLHAMTGDYETAARFIGEGNAILDELGRLQSAVSHHEALVELLAGRPEAAEARLRLGYERLEQMGERGLLATTAAMLAQALYEQGRHDEADAQCAVSEASAPRDDLVTHVVWRGVRARVYARAGRAAAGEALAREALALIERTDLLSHHGDALLDLADVLALAGRPSDAADAARAALALYERKGNLVSAARALRRLAHRDDGSPEVDDGSAVPVRQGRHDRRRRQGQGVRPGGARDG